MTRTKGPRASEQERVERRRAANRRSARKSRYRENVQMGELQKTMTELLERNQALKAENDAFKEELAMLQGIMSYKTLQPKMETIQTSPFVGQPLSQPYFVDPMKLSLSHIVHEIPRTPSPVESLINPEVLNPDKIFPIEKDRMNCNFPMQTATSMFRAAFVAPTGAM